MEQFLNWRLWENCTGIAPEGLLPWQGPHSGAGEESRRRNNRDKPLWTRSWVWQESKWEKDGFHLFLFLTILLYYQLAINYSLTNGLFCLWFVEQPPCPYFKVFLVCWFVWLFNPQYFPPPVLLWKENKSGPVGTQQPKLTHHRRVRFLNKLVLQYRTHSYFLWGKLSWATPRVSS